MTDEERGCIESAMQGIVYCALIYARRQDQTDFIRPWARLRKAIGESAGSDDWFRYQEMVSGKSLTELWRQA